MDPLAAKYIGAGIACIGMGGAGIGVGHIFGNFLSGALRNPAAAGAQFTNALIGAALANSRTTGMTRAISSSGGTGDAPGRVDSPPTSKISAPASSMAWPAAIAALASKCRPPSEKLSGVMLRIPITRGRNAAMPAKGAGRAVTASISSPHSSGNAATGRVAISRPSSTSRASEKARSPPCKGSA